jgi:hypothetical protein
VWCGVDGATDFERRYETKADLVKATLALRVVTAGALKVGVAVVGRLALTIWRIVTGVLSTPGESRWSNNLRANPRRPAVGRGFAPQLAGGLGWLLDGRGKRDFGRLDLGECRCTVHTM